MWPMQLHEFLVPDRITGRTVRVRLLRPRMRLNPVNVLLLYGSPARGAALSPRGSFGRRRERRGYGRFGSRRKQWSADGPGGVDCWEFQSDPCAESCSRPMTSFIASRFRSSALRCDPDCAVRFLSDLTCTVTGDGSLALSTNFSSHRSTNFRLSQHQEWKA